MCNKPILFIVFNRPNTTKLILDVLKRNKPKFLYIASDGPRKEVDGDKLLVNEVRKICENIDWECNVERLYQTENLGCSLGPRTALSWFFSIEEEGIILEDDCLPNDDFFKFCELLLEYYRNNDRILNICGSNMGYSSLANSSYFYSRFMNMSGWATWRRSANEIDYELKHWKKTKNKKIKSYKLLRQDFFDFDLGWYRYWYHKFNLTVQNEFISWWDWQWIYYQLENKKLSIIPNKNLVKNIGFNSDATHTIDPNNPLSNIPTENIDFPIVHPRKVKLDFIYEEFAVKWVWCYHKRLPTIFYVKQFVSKFIRSAK